MKFFRLFFSRVFIVGIAIILQILLFVATNFWLSSSFWWVSYFFDILAILIFFVVVNKDKPASFKLPWIMILLLVPIVGIVLYFLFGDFRLSSKTKKELMKQNKDLKKFCLQNEKTMYSLMAKDYQAYGQAKYIENTCFLPTYQNCFVKYLSTGEEFFDSLLTELKSAEKYIFMEYFIIERGKMWNSILEILEQKVKEGVEVYLMYDDVGCIAKIPNDYFLTLRDKGINACKFNPFRPVVSVMHNNRDHRKITVIDGKIGFVGGTNLADEYINVVHPYGNWKDNALLMKGKCVDSLIIMFLSLYNTSSIKKLDIKNYLAEHELYDDESFVAPYCDGPAPIDNDYISQNVYLNMINQSQEYIYMTTPYLIVDFSFMEALINAAKRGVDVRVITPFIPDKKIIKIMTKSSYSKLIENGVKVYEYKPGFIHSKMFVCDDKYGIVGTVNLDYRSLVHHFECGIWLFKNVEIKKMKEDINDIVENNSIKINIDEAKLSFFERIIKDVINIFAPLM